MTNKTRAAKGRRVLAYFAGHKVAKYEALEQTVDCVADIGHALLSKGFTMAEVQKQLDIAMRHVEHEVEYARQVKESKILTYTPGRSVYILVPLNRLAKSWIESNIGPDLTWAMGGIVVEHRFIDDVVRGINGLALGQFFEVRS